MRIGLDVSAALAGASGIKLYVEETLAGLSRVGAGHEFLLYTSFWREPQRLEALRLPKAPNFSFHFHRLPQRLLLPADEYLGTGIQARWIERQRVDVFHGLGNTAPPLRATPSAVTLHHVGGLPADVGWWDRFYFEALAERSIRRADAVIAVSEFSRAEAVRRYGLEPGKAVAILEGGAAPQFHPAPAGAARPDWLPPEPYLLSVGAIVERKNLASVARALASMRTERRATLSWAIAGPPGPAYEPLRALLRELGIEVRTRFFHGLAKERLVELYQHAGVLVYPSLLEGFGFPVLEAMACGVPVVASTSGSIPEIAGEAAELVDPARPDALAAALERVLDDASWARELARRGLERARTFSWDRSARETLAVYARISRRSG